MNKILLVFFILGFASASFADQESCSGTGMLGGYVYGTCTDGSFNGYEGGTAASIFGTCSDGYFSGTVIGTGEQVSGTCTRIGDQP